MMYRFFDHGYGFRGSGYCPGPGFIGNGFGMWIGIGILAVIVLLFAFFVYNKKKKTSYNEAVEVLKMKYVQGEISEEEYIRRKNVLGR